MGLVAEERCSTSAIYSHTTTEALTLERKDKIVSCSSSRGKHREDVNVFDNDVGLSWDAETRDKYRE